MRLLFPSFFCPATWDSMAGDETCRFCTHCQREVHNLNALDAADRAALLDSATSAAQVCGRYRAVLRRPAPGHEKAYWRHLARYGAGVAVAGAATVVIWESQQRDQSPLDYVIGHLAGRPAMPTEFYLEDDALILGAIICEDPQIDADHADEWVADQSVASAFVPQRRFHLTPAQVQALFPASLPPPRIEAPLTVLAAPSAR